MWGEATFISGCHNAEWCFMMAPIFETEDAKAPKLDSHGQPTFRMWFLHKSQFEIQDTWNVSALSVSSTRSETSASSSR